MDQYERYDRNFSLVSLNQFFINVNPLYFRENNLIV